MIKDNTFIYEDYVMPDKKEAKLNAELSRVSIDTLEYKELRKKLKSTMTRNRGIKFDIKGKFFVDSRLFSEYIITRMALFKVAESFYIYNLKEHKYEAISVDSILYFIMQIMRECKESYYDVRIENELLTWISRKVKNLKSFIETVGYVVLKNGTYTIEGHSFKKKFNRSIFTLSSLEFSYDSNVKCPNFLAFLNDIFEGNQRMIQLMQQIFGYTFTYGSVKTHKFFYFYGAGRNGKSVLAKILTDLHGKNNVSAVFLDNLTKQFAMSSLVGKVLNISPEGKQTKFLDTSIIKSLTAGDTVMIEKKYQDPYPCKLSTKFIILSNYSLRTEDDSYGFQQRIVPIPFKKQYQELPYDGIYQEGVSYQDPSLYDKLKVELSGIFNWAMEGLKELQKNNWVFITCKEVDELREKFMLQNRPVRLFFKSCFKVDCENECIKSSEVMQTFVKWASKNHIPMLSYSKSAEFHQEFRRILEQENLNSITRKRKGYDHYYGIKLKDDYLNFM